MNNKELKELMSIICEGQDSEQRRKVENFIEYQVQLIDSLDKEIERLNNDIKELFKENSNKEKVIIAQDNIIKEVREYIKENKASLPTGRDDFTCEMRYSDPVVLASKLLEILDKENNNE